ncbi:carbohydrate ABC transporter substrate-binding protein [Lachnospiraceae bacterium]|jgi:ABC-type glycerol-3-phosphate transport system substrate-binding protein|nr:ABC transporter substrate-binding protein [uncultured Schaedlerella sp.]MCI9152795.1 carbohydrate ABC transporter substrate-binding protein [Ruminococcus sp.]NBI59903.1 carbohydrate ABC transporter substrate-binding protein [Lachnospiraceae bacterium]
MKRKWKKKILKAVGISLCMAMLGCGLAACGNNKSGAGGGEAEGGGQEASPEEEVTITFYWGSIEDDMKQVWYDGFFDPFVEEHPNVKIDFQCLPDVQETLRVQLAAGSGPDLFMVDCFDVPDYVEAGALKDLTAYREEYKWDDVIYDWALDAGTIDGQLYGVAHGSEATSIYCNRDLLKELGCEVPETRAEFEDACIKAADAGYIPIEYGYSGANEFQQWIYDHYLGNYSGKENLKKLFTGELKFMDEEIKGAFELLKSDWDAGWINQGQSGAISNDEARTFFQNEQAVFCTEGTWLTMETLSPGTLTFDWVCTAWPSMKDGIPASGSAGIGAMMAMNANTEHADLCAELLNFFYSDEQRLANAIAAGYMTLCCDVDEELYPEDIEADIRKTLDSMGEILGRDTVGYAPWSAYPSDTNIYMMNNLDKVYYGEYTVEQFCEEAQKVLDKELEEGFEFVG